MPKKLNKSVLWVFALALTTTSVAVAQLSQGTPKPIVNQWGMTAPFLLSWLPIWFFCAMGGIGSIFVKVDNIDSRFRLLYVAKPFLGVMGGISLSIFLTDGRDPPEIVLTAYACIASFLASAILQFVLVLLSTPKNSLAVINKVSPVQFELEQGGGHDKS